MLNKLNVYMCEYVLDVDNLHVTWVFMEVCECVNILNVVNKIYFDFLYVIKL